MESLPVELLSKIMVDIVHNEEAGYPLRCWGSTEDGDNYKDFAEYWLPIHRTKPQAFGPLQLGLVCRLWKQVAEQTATLWNRLAVNLDDVMDSDVAVSKLMGDLSLRITLSRQAPLHILIVLDSWDRLEARRFTKIFHDVLLSSHRWSSLQMRLPSEHWSILLHCGKEPLSQLSHLSLTNLSLVPIVPKETPSWQALTHLALEGVNTRDMDMDMSTVTHLRLVDSNLHFPWNGLTRALRLKHLIFDNCGVDTQTSGPPEVIVCGSVKHFTFHATFPAPHVNVLAIFAFPALEEFVLTEDTTSNSRSVGLLAFMSACGQSLRRFVLREDPYNTQPRPCKEILELLAHLPSVEYLELEFQYVGLFYFDPLLKRLAFANETDGPNPGFLPNLRALQFNSLHGISWPLLPSIFWPSAPIDSTARGRPLQHLTVKHMSALDTDRLTIDVINELRILCDRGVKICLYNKENKRLYLEDLG